MSTIAAKKTAERRPKSSWAFIGVCANRGVIVRRRSHEISMITEYPDGVPVYRDVAKCNCGLLVFREGE